MTICSDHTEPVFVTHIRNPCHFVVQLNRNIDRLTELSRAINTYCKTAASKDEIPSHVEPGVTLSLLSLSLSVAVTAFVQCTVNFPNLVLVS